MNTKLVNAVLAAGFLLAGCAERAASPLPFVELAKPQPGQIQVAGFVLEREASVVVDAVGRTAGHGDTLAAFGWIIDSTTRREVWHMDLSRAATSFQDLSLYSSHKVLRLAPGRYEAYLAAGLYRDQTAGGVAAIARLLEHLAQAHTGKPPAPSLEQCRLSLAVDGSLKPARFEPGAALAGALIAFNRVGNSESHEAGFALTRRQRLRLYTVFEQIPGQRNAADAAWITRYRTRERVWNPEPASAERAGGAAKNARIDTEIELDAGEYVLSFASDDSHAYPEFNDLPPHDPFNWGVTLLPGKDFDPSAFRRFPAERPAPLLDARRAGNNADLRRRFSLRHDGVLWLKAEGEFAGGQGVDHAWIEDAGNGTRVWEMSLANTMAGGGAAKNRAFDGLLPLPAGSYVARFQSDDSHAYGGWNSAAPFEPEGWGLVAYPGPGLDRADFQLEAEPEAVPGGGR